MAPSLIKLGSPRVGSNGRTSTWEEGLDLLSHSPSSEIFHLYYPSLADSNFYYCTALKDSAAPLSITLAMFLHTAQP